jgi:hypothetical protein
LDHEITHLNRVAFETCVIEMFEQIP